MYTRTRDKNYKHCVQFFWWCFKERPSLCVATKGRQQLVTILEEFLIVLAFFFLRPLNTRAFVLVFRSRMYTRCFCNAETFRFFFSGKCKVFSLILCCFCGIFRIFTKTFFLIFFFFFVLLCFPYFFVYLFVFTSLKHMV